MTTIPSSSVTVRYLYADVKGVRVFYREAGATDAPTMLLLHGFPSSSHQFRNLIPLLADRFHVIAPDLPGFGFTEVPAQQNYQYTFDNLTKTMAGFIDVLGVDRYAMYVFDYGAPVGLRLLQAQPERITGLVSQNGNAYEEGLSESWAPVKAYWADPSTHRQAIHDALLSLEATRSQYLHGVKEPELIAPETYWLDTLLMERPGNKDIQLALTLDYGNNVKQYPEFQAALRKSRFPTLIIWGKHDPFFIPPGAEAFKRDIPDAVVEMLDTGHFALETHVVYIAQRIREVLGNAPLGI